MRANNALVRGVLDLRFWGYSYKYATLQVNVAGGHFGAVGDNGFELTGYAPYGSLIAYHDADLAKNDLRASLGIYLGRQRPVIGRNPPKIPPG